jgi:hypothetical protein
MSILQNSRRRRRRRRRRCRRRPCRHRHQHHHHNHHHLIFALYRSAFYFASTFLEVAVVEFWREKLTFIDSLRYQLIP